MNRRFVRFILFAIPAVIISGSVLSCAPKGYSGTVESLTIAWSPFEHQTLCWIAQDQGIFGKNGLNVTTIKYDTGAASLNGVLNREADIVVGVTEFPFVKKAFENANIKIVGTIARVEQLSLVARQDSGIRQVSDLKGKRVGTTLGTVAEFYLSRFLELNKINSFEVSIIDLKTPYEWENAVADGFVDAVVTAQPYADMAAKHLENNAVIWPVQSGQFIYGLVVASGDLVQTKPEAVRRFLVSLVEAESYTLNHPPVVKATLQKHLSAEPALIDLMLELDRFSVSLDESLIVAMEDEARWVIDNSLTDKTQVPFFNDFINESMLESIKPEAVNIIR
jgi:ABC-type nitrate/sulfonate/bicarbonate transport system substrate-binding protein